MIFDVIPDYSQFYLFELSKGKTLKEVEARLRVLAMSYRRTK